MHRQSLNVSKCRLCYYVCISTDGQASLLDAVRIKQDVGGWQFDFEPLQCDNRRCLIECDVVCNDQSSSNSDSSCCCNRACNSCTTLHWPLCLEQVNGCSSKHRTVTLHLDTHFTAALITALSRCPAVILRFASFCWSEFQINVTPGTTVGIFVSHPRKFFLDYQWNSRMTSLILRQMALDDAMNWLNTLGGGYSALGDYFEFHAVEAGKISMKQLRVAMEMGDEPTVIRCHLYCALSLMQRGYFTAAKHLIRSQYARANGLPVRDSRLLNMCQGLWAKLRHTINTRHRQRHNSKCKHSTLVPVSQQLTNC